MRMVGVFTRLFRWDGFVQQAISSVLEQTFADFTYYILVNEITRPHVEEYAKTDDRITVLEASERAQGFRSYYKALAEKHKYLITADGDDWLEKNCLQELVFCAEKNNLDMTLCGNSFVIGERVVSGVREVAEDKIMTEKEAWHELPVMYQFMRTLWGCLFRSSMLLKTETLPTSAEYGGYGGDTMTMFYLLSYSGKVGVVKGYLYNYRQGNASAASSTLKAGRIQSDAMLFHYVKNILEEKECGTEENIDFLYCIYLNAIKDTLRLVMAAGGEAKRESIRSVLENPLTTQLFEKEAAGSLIKYTGSTKSISAQLAEIILPIFECENSEGMKENYKIFSVLFPEYYGRITETLFGVITKDTKLLNALIQRNPEGVMIGFLGAFLNISEEDRERVRKLLLLFSSDVVTKSLFCSEKFICDNRYLLLLYFGKQYDKFFEVCSQKLEADPEEEHLILADLWIHLAASLENADLFVEGKIMRFNLLSLLGKETLARAEYEDLKEMGIRLEL